MTNTEAPIHVLRIDHVVLRVTDLARAEAFYRGLLGASVERRIDKPIVLVQLRVGESLLDLVPGRKTDEGQNMDHFCMRVEPFDAEAIAARVRSFGGEPEPMRELYGADGYGPSIYFRDLDGNRVELKGAPTRQLGDAKP
jgi:glyoxylase I family protein